MLTELLKKNFGTLLPLFYHPHTLYRSRTSTFTKEKVLVIWRELDQTGWVTNAIPYYIKKSNILEEYVTFTYIISYCITNPDSFIITSRIFPFFSFLYGANFHRYCYLYPLNRKFLTKASLFYATPFKNDAKRTLRKRIQRFVLFILEKRDIRWRKEVWVRKTKQDITFAYLCVHFFSD